MDNCPLYRKGLQFAVRSLARKPQTESEIKKKLVKREINDPAVIEAIIKRLHQYGYLNDLKFTQAWLRHREVSQPRGVYFLRRELKQRGVKNDVIEQCVNECDFNEHQSAINLLEKKKRYLEKFAENKVKEKIFLLLKRRGYSLDTVYKIINSW